MDRIDPSAPLTASADLRRRERTNRIMLFGATASAVFAVVILGLVIFTVLAKGASSLSLDFLTKDPPIFGGPGGGIAPEIIGSILIVAMATIMALPLGVLIAIYMSEFARPRTAQPIRLALDLLNGIPSIVIGVFVFGVLVAGKHQSGFAAAVALAIIELPLIARGTQEVLTLVPQALRDAAAALGVSHWRTTFGVVLPSALGGIVTSVVLAVARAAGETAPLILLCAIYSNTVSLNIFSGAVPNIPVSIFTLSESPDPADHARAWGSALVLMAFILIANLGARYLLARSRRKLTR